MKELAKSLIPPVLLNFITGFFYGWSGNYSSYSEAKNKSNGYDQDNILEKVKKATRQAVISADCYERDGVLFKSGTYHYALLSSLAFIHLKKKSKINLIDFGGSLGSLYWQHRQMIVPELVNSWNIVEQEHFVQLGRDEFENEVLKFHYTIQDGMAISEVDLMILSSVIQYLEDPDAFLDDVLELGLPYLFIDRSAFTSSSKNRLTVQKVHPSIYKGSYPCWFLSYDKFMDKLLTRYEVVFEFDAIDRSNLKGTFFKGVFLKLK